jgi:hypothetical protein
MCTQVLIAGGAFWHLDLRKKEELRRMAKAGTAVLSMLAGLLLAGTGFDLASPALAQEVAAASPDTAGAAESEAEPLSPEEMEVLVARIALYPDDLVAVISAASLYPLQIVEAQRFLDDSKTKKDLKPKSDWDGSIISLLNYPEIVAMMSDDLDWTQLLGEAIVNQQQDVFTAIQMLREKAVAEGVIKTDEKVKIVKEQDNIVIQPASAEVIYVPQYEPAMLYEPDYVYTPVTYYPEPYPYYYSPVAPFFAGVVTGAVWGAVIDWDDGFWGGNWNGGWGGNNDIDIDCNRCIIGSDFNGKLNINNVDWRNVDRSKINFDKNQFNKIDRTNIKNNIKANDRNNIRNKSADLKNNRPNTLPGKGNKPVKDVRASTLEGLKKQPGNKPGDKMARPGDKMAKPGEGVSNKMAKPGQGGGDKLANAGNKRPEGGKIDRPVGKPKPAAKADKRPDRPSPMGEMKSGKIESKYSERGAKSAGGGMKRPEMGGGGNRKPQMSGGGGRKLPKGGGGGGGRKRR